MLHIDIDLKGKGIKSKSNIVIAWVPPKGTASPQVIKMLEDALEMLQPNNGTYKSVQINFVTVLRVHFLLSDAILTLLICYISLI